jgi:hypothetical protein
MSLWCELLVVSFLWATVVAGLICVVCDCVRDWRREATALLLDLDVEVSHPCCGLDSVELPPCQREQPLRKKGG